MSNIERRPCCERNLRENPDAAVSFCSPSSGLHHRCSIKDHTERVPPSVALWWIGRYPVSDILAARESSGVSVLCSCGNCRGCCRLSDLPIGNKGWHWHGRCKTAPRTGLISANTAVSGNAPALFGPGTDYIFDTVSSEKSESRVHTSICPLPCSGGNNRSDFWKYFGVRA